MMLDHPGWLTAEDGTAFRAVRAAAEVWTAVVTPAGRRLHLTAPPGARPAPVVDVVDPASLAGEHPLVEVLRQAGPVARLRNPDLWDALVTSIIRQVIRAGQARALYRAFCTRHGEPATTPAGTAWLVPTPRTVLGLTDTEFTHLGMAFKRGALRAAAAAYLDHGPDWTRLPAAILLADVQQVPRVGRWTAGATVADHSNDFSLYPFADLAVRTWASRLVPDHPWPDNEPGFGRYWRDSAGAQLSAWTLLTLASGARHAHTPASRAPTPANEGQRPDRGR